MADIFVSYTSADRDWAFWIGQELEELGHSPRLHDWEIKAGEDILSWMEPRLDNAARVLCVVSENYLKAPYSTMERNAALWKSATTPGFGVIAVVRQCQIPALYEPIKRIDLCVLAEVEARAVLAEAFANDDSSAPMSSADSMRSRRRNRVPFPGGSQPSAIKTASNIQIRIPRHFLGRKQELAAIDATLKGGGGDHLALAALHGLRGVGKTTLAAAYAKAHSGEYRATWWIDAQSEVTMRADLVSLGVKLGWVNESESAEAALDLVRDRLNNEGEGILLVYDNANDLDEFVAYAPRGGASHVIVTSNAPYWSRLATPVQIKVWPAQMGADYLLARMPGNESRAEAIALTKALGGLPLALEQASAYCERVGVSIPKYREQFEKTPAVIRNEKDAPAEYRNKTTVAKTFAMAIDKATERNPAAELLIGYAALLAPEPIPLFLFLDARDKFGEPLASALTEEGLNEAIAVLREFALVDRETVVDERDPSITTDCIRLHRLVRIVAALRWDEARPSLALHRDSALENIVAAFTDIYPKDVRDSPRVWLLFPHIVMVLQRLVNENEVSEAREMLDELTRLVVMALRVAEDKQRAGNLVPEYLARVLGDFYEVEPLRKPIGLLLENHRDAWPGLEEQFLSTNNYVLRYAMANAMADVHCRDPSLVTMGHLVALVLQARNVNEFDLGGYALNLIYARDPDKIAREILTALAERREYSGRSILGDLFLNLAFRRIRVPELRECVPSDRFWKPIWDFIWIDIHAIEAVGFLMAEPRRDPPVGSAAATVQDFRNLARIELDIEEFKQSAPRAELIIAMLENYLVLGQDQEIISRAEDDFANLSHPDLREIVRLLFTHPIWAVGEAAASALSRLVEKNADLIRVVEELLQNGNWRVRYGACEAAFILRKKHLNVFRNSVQRYYKDETCKVRGLCAENLCSYILNSSIGRRATLIAEFKTEFDFWMVDEDCWVLEHLFRFFNTLNKRHVDVESLLPVRVSRLLDGAAGWYTWERGKFLRHIEQRKEQLL